ncbi:hypothetical protein BS47DRAFT_1390783 [Hydnum rufescens UP504]|uniref:RRM domain-containing protein n=1 Tax=Hydnum rufescens UP504 TaxID=1448309 RepID=A0A9P6DVE1_9AGAM|nr:hypothetical protein BS47DRAFT_1390783 [Hydnum rufescens UP504]
MTAIYSVQVGSDSSSLSLWLPREVSNIAPNTTKETLHEFFSFCGKINHIDLKAGDGEKTAQTATVAFEKASAVKTALMLNGGALDGSDNIAVTSDSEHVDVHANNNSGHPTEQESKPRAGIAAEYLAKGYHLSDSILQRTSSLSPFCHSLPSISLIAVNSNSNNRPVGAIEIDQKQGISTRFLEYIKTLDRRVGSKTIGPDQTVSGKLQATITHLDEQHSIKKQAEDYYAKAINSPFGQKVYSFYSTTSKQVLDIHEEAKRIAAQHKAANAPQTTGAPAEASASATTGLSEKAKQE